MGRYSKLHSNYILSKKHQVTHKGTIFERDWVTIGSQHQIEKGKKPYYSDTNFLFTDNSYPSYKKKYNYGKWVASWDYDDVKDAKDEVNKVKVNKTSNDIRDFAYYGSAVELVKSSVTNIINWFPAYVACSHSDIYVPNEDGTGFVVLTGTRYNHMIVNPFNIDFVHTLSQEEKEGTNVDRFMAESYTRYMIKFGNDTPGEIIAYRKTQYVPLNSNSDNSFGVYTENEAKTKIKSGEYRYADCYPEYWLPGGNRKPLYQINLGAENETHLELIFQAYIIDSEIVLLTKNSGTSGNPDFMIIPKEEVFEEYFNNLDDFEKQLLTLNSKPVYRNSFLTPFEGETDYKYVYRDYTWPSISVDGYPYSFIDIVSEGYTDYLSRLVDMATTYDELWCDSLYRNMTHEAIKNFDWTYTKDYTDGDEQDNIDGGNQMMKLLRIYGRAFDDLKRYADGIGFVSKNTYDGYNNEPDAEISDRLELMGWDAPSVIPDATDGNTDIIKIEKSFLDNGNYKWFDAQNSEDIDTAKTDINFAKHLLLSSSRILNTKGTTQAIDMVMALFGFGEKDYTLTERFYKIPYSSLKNFDDEYTTSEEETMTYGELVDNINFYKDYPKAYDDIYSGVPLGDYYVSKKAYVNKNNGSVIGQQAYNELDDNTKKDYEEVMKTTHYIIPFYTQKRVYDGDLYFNSKGGWGKNDIDGQYLETMSYLHIVDDFSELLNLNPSSLNDEDIYYVSDMTTYSEYVETLPENLSHFFVIIENGKYNPQLPESWANVDMTSDTDIAKKAKYLDSLVSNNIGNNPHVGYGAYDMGEDFIEYMKKPFKFALDEELLPDEWKDEADNFTFVADYEDSVVVFGNGNEDNIYGKVKIIDDGTTDYYINHKYLKLKFNLDDERQPNELFRNYFMNVVLKYVMQVIPSTTILEINFNS